MAALTQVGQAVVVDVKFGQKIRQLLEQKGLWDAERRLEKIEGTKVAIPIKPTFIRPAKSFQADVPYAHYGDGTIVVDGTSFVVRNLLLPLSKKKLLKTPWDKLQHACKGLMEQNGILWSEAFERELPHNWEKHGDLVLLPDKCFSSAEWSTLGAQLWQCVADALVVRRVAKVKRVCADQYRSPKVALLWGNDGWVEHIDNGIRCRFDITKCMFSFGNITEKLRIADFNCEGETVVDLYAGALSSRPGGNFMVGKDNNVTLARAQFIHLYKADIQVLHTNSNVAGIGYFTLPYLVHAGAGMVHACEWNPHAVKALRQNLLLNNVQERCMVYEGDNRETCPKGIADRVNLGLIPSSEAGWPVACAALKPDTGGIMHIHGNVDSVRRDCAELTEKPDEGSHMPGTVHGGTSDFGASGQFQLSTQENFSKPDLPQCTYCNSVEYGLTDKGRIEWENWARYVARSVKMILENEHKREWTTSVLHIEHVKSYGPHVDHLVVDIKCLPVQR